MTTPDWNPVPLAFEVVAHERGPDEERVLAITSVLRDDFALRVNYEIVPPLGDDAEFGPWGRPMTTRGIATTTTEACTDTTPRRTAPRAS